MTRIRFPVGIAMPCAPTRLLKAIDGVEALGIDPTAVCPDHWRHLHHRLTEAQEPRPYTRECHEAWLRRGCVS